MPRALNMDYVGRVNRAIDHIINNVGQPLRLEDVAQVANFSPFHFHRIFKGLVGETLNAFIKRVRLERAVYLLSHRKNTSLTDVALACGFSSSSDFSRNFRSHYGVAPRAFDVESFRRSKRGQMLDSLTSPQDRHRLERLPVGENPDGFEVRLRDLPARRVAYIRVHKPYQGDGVTEAIARLMSWARARELAGGQWLGYQWDDPEIVALEQCRYDIGIEVPNTTVGGGEVVTTDFPPMKVAELELAGPVELAQRALDWLFLTWLPQSGFAPAHQPCFEAFKGEPYAHGMTHFELSVHLPVLDAAVPL
ncbi:MAG: AraC family transcriptional regulator [Nannocystaceae bacterium]|nr:AraC family transcriptional regulator [Nannocystaceae bacterium]